VLGDKKQLLSILFLMKYLKDNNLLCKPTKLQSVQKARYHGLTLATRNVSDFAHCGVEVINPFQ